MLLGGEVSIPTLDGKSVLLTIPPETQSGRIFRLAGLGMPQLRNPAVRSDLYVNTRVNLPTGLSDQEKKLLSEMARLRNHKP
jgi:DnaJ-class molecular chaperone